MGMLRLTATMPLDHLARTAMRQGHTLRLLQIHTATAFQITVLQPTAPRHPVIIARRRASGGRLRAAAAGTEPWRGSGERRRAAAQMRGEIAPPEEEETQKTTLGKT